jgi:F0F1-type ATP synthase delta subunit
VAVSCRDCHTRVTAAAKKRQAKKRKEFATQPVTVTVTVPAAAPLTPKQKRSLWMALASKFVSAKVAPAPSST